MTAVVECPAQFDKSTFLKAFNIENSETKKKSQDPTDLL